MGASRVGRRAERTSGGTLRHPTYVATRDDKYPRHWSANGDSGEPLAEGAVGLEIAAATIYRWRAQATNPSPTRDEMATRAAQRVKVTVGDRQVASLASSTPGGSAHQGRQQAHDDRSPATSFLKRRVVDASGQLVLEPVGQRQPTRLFLNRSQSAQAVCTAFNAAATPTTTAPKSTDRE